MRATTVGQWLVTIMVATTMTAALTAPATAEDGPVQPWPGDIVKNYFPLHENASWEYQRVGVSSVPAPTVKMQTSGLVIVGADFCYGIRNYTFGVVGDEIMFYNSRGCTREIFRDQRGVWYDWTDLNGEVEIPAFEFDCFRGSHGRMLPARVMRVLAGKFEDVVTVYYDEWPCCDGGVVSESFAADVGLIQRQTMTIAGIQTWQLKEAHVNGVIYRGGRTSSFLGAASSNPSFEESTWGGIKSTFTQ